MMVARAIILLAFAACLAAFAMPVAAQITLSLPLGAEQTASRNEALASYALPIAAWEPGKPHHSLLEGRLSQSAWRLRDTTASSLQILRELRAQLLAAGYEVIFECDTDVCGGFDFRFAMQILPEPEMHVDLGDFRYLAAVRGAGEDAEHLALVVSRSTGSGFVHVTQIGPSEAEPLAPVIAAPELAPAAPTGNAQGSVAAPVSVAELAALLEQAGRATLDDLEFDTGASTLHPSSYASLRALAEYLAANPARRVVLVGHTDAVGDLAANIALSRKRAEAVRTRLIEVLSVNPAQLGAEGAGWLAPRDSNLTPEGRAKNRRVEVVLTST
ncbi:OmpA family protein [Phaeovulum sp.]|uniref:OmpA family protein n=1 Tax=Phaeovulum sp. TaxID=2934796 RepID=UPI00356814D2